MIASRWVSVNVCTVLWGWALLHLLEYAPVEPPAPPSVLIAAYAVLALPLMAGFWMRQIGVLRAGSNQLSEGDLNMVQTYKRRLDDKAINLRQKVDNFPK